MATVTELLDQLAAGTITVPELAADFATRSWPPPPVAGRAEYFGAQDPPRPGANSWQAVESDARITAEQYHILAAAYDKAVESRR